MTTAPTHRRDNIMTVRFYHPILGMPRTDCPTMPILRVYGMAASFTVVLLVLGYPVVTALEVPLMALAGVRVLATVNVEQVITFLRAILTAAGSLSGGASA